MRNRQLLYDVAMSHFGIPYLWGGKNPMVGLDCSGLVQCILSAVGMGPQGVANAQNLYEYFLVNGHRSDAELGAISFYGNVSKIHHVGFCLDDKRMVEAAFGGSAITSKETAVARGARVKVSPITRLDDLFAVLVPRYETVGL